MNATSLVQEIRAAGGRLELDGDDIRLIKPKGVVIPASLLKAARAQKDALRASLQCWQTVRRWRAGVASFGGSFVPCPGFSPEKWHRVRQAAWQFLTEFGERAAALGWTDVDLFGVHPEVGIVRGDCSGALMLSNGRRIVAVSESTIAYEDKLTFYLKPLRGPSLVIWQFKGGPNG